VLNFFKAFGFAGIASAVSAAAEVVVSAPSFKNGDNARAAASAIDAAFGAITEVTAASALSNDAAATGLAARASPTASLFECSPLSELPSLCRCENPEAHRNWPNISHGSAK
jgi:hypothetical protein